jgi:hypothetical protein
MRHSTHGAYSINECEQRPGTPQRVETHVENAKSVGERVVEARARVGTAPSPLWPASPERLPSDSRNEVLLHRAAELRVQGLSRSVAIEHHLWKG